ncbi:tRNA wybutosine-synthesizing protein 3 homolog isoform X2 [Camarhynchus parvulus]|uniref:tRNA wybutosine-synthesizing protein 3 homolog isoform X2 n=1 Tax=Geospiza parvula TaxID=87175 RepID=UPI00123813AB|nr:tRNA wybutosine-synthesizing protein 3 homolog isoform X2 [Camarhynchus parvulus]
MAAFARRKAQRLARPDPSRKRALDARAAELARLLNARDSFCTTSSCDGRVILTVREGRDRQGMVTVRDGRDRQGMVTVRDGRDRQRMGTDTDGMGIQKKNCTWLLVTHDPCVKGDVMTALKKATGDVVFKFEPFVLHVLCRELQDAQLLHSVAIDSGFRNSGITVGRGGKITMAVRSTHCLEVPLSHKGRLMVSEEYIEFLVHVANQKMEENRKRIDRFHKGLELALEAAVPADTLFPEGLEKSHSVYMHRRKRRTAQEQADPSRELEPQDDTESSLGLFAEIMI